MTRYQPIFAVLFALILSGCPATTGPLRDALHSATDRVIKQLGALSDRGLDNLDEARALVKTELDRMDAAYCLFPLPALRRYAEETVEQRRFLAEKCGLIIELDTLRLPAEAGVIE